MIPPVLLFKLHCSKPPDNTLFSKRMEKLTKNIVFYGIKLNRENHLHHAFNEKLVEVCRLNERSWRQDVEKGMFETNFMKT